MCLKLCTTIGFLHHNRLAVRRTQAQSAVLLSLPLCCVCPALQVLVPLLNAEIDQQGPLAQLIEERGPSYDDIRAGFRKEGLPTRLEMPAPAGEALALAL